MKRIFRSALVVGLFAIISVPANADNVNLYSGDYFSVLMPILPTMGNTYEITAPACFAQQFDSTAGFSLGGAIQTIAYEKGGSCNSWDATVTVAFVVFGYPLPSKPQNDVQHPQVVAAVQVADLLLRSEKIGCSGNYLDVLREDCFNAPGWKMLLHDTSENEQNIASASLSSTLEQIPQMLKGLV